MRGEPGVPLSDTHTKHTTYNTITIYKTAATTNKTPTAADVGYFDRPSRHTRKIRSVAGPLQSFRAKRRSTHKASANAQEHEVLVDTTLAGNGASEDTAFPIGGRQCHAWRNRRPVSSVAADELRGYQEGSPPLSVDQASADTRPLRCCKIRKVDAGATIPHARASPPACRGKCSQRRQPHEPQKVKV